MATEQFYESLQKFSDNGLRWKSVSSGSTSQSVVYNEFDAANVLFSAPGGEVYEVGSDMATLESDVAAVIQRITGRDYHTIAAALANGEITVEEVETWRESWHHEEVGVSPVAKLVIAAALTIATGPAVFGAGGSSCQTAERLGVLVRAKRNGRCHRRNSFARDESRFARPWESPESQKSLPVV